MSYKLDDNVGLLDEPVDQPKVVLDKAGQPLEIDATKPKKIEPYLSLEDNVGLESEPQLKPYLKLEDNVGLEKPLNFFGQMRETIEKGLGEIAVIESPEFKKIKQEHIQAISKAHKLDPKEVETNYEEYAFDPKIGMATKPLLAKIMHTKLPPEGGGPMRDLEATLNFLMTPVVVAGLTVHPVATITALTGMTGINLFTEFAGVGKEIE